MPDSVPFMADAASLPVPVLIPAADLAARVAEMGEAINRHYGNRPLTVIVVATGAFVFAADLVRELRMPVRLDLISVSSYEGTRSTGEIVLHLPPRVELADQPVLVVDDIHDTGLTLRSVTAELLRLGASEVRTCVLLARRDTPPSPGDPEFVGFRLANEFVVGYGLDFRHWYRNLPYLGVLPETGSASPTPASD